TLAPKCATQPRRTRQIRIHNAIVPGRVHAYGTKAPSHVNSNFSVRFFHCLFRTQGKEKRCVTSDFGLAWEYREPTVPGVHKHMDGATQFAVSALINILTSLICITLSWWVLQNVRLDLFLRNPG